MDGHKSPEDVSSVSQAAGTAGPTFDGTLRSVKIPRSLGDSHGQSSCRMAVTNS
jgi:hypothetical protein